MSNSVKEMIALAVILLAVVCVGIYSGGFDTLSTEVGAASDALSAEMDSLYSLFDNETIENDEVGSLELNGSIQDPSASSTSSTVVARGVTQ